MSVTLNRATNTNDAGSPRTSGAYHFDSRSSTHLQSPRVNASQDTRSKPYSTNHREEEDPTWPFALSRAVYNRGVMCARTNLRKKTPCGIQNLGLSRPTLPMSTTLNRATNTNDAGSPRTSGAYHFDSRPSTHLQSPRVNARQPTRSKPYNTNHCEEEGPTWPFASTQAVHNSGVVRARTIYAKKNRLHNAVYKNTKDVCHNL